jgi:hypothetical protein
VVEECEGQCFAAEAVCVGGGAACAAAALALVVPVRHVLLQLGRLALAISWGHTGGRHRSCEMQGKRTKGVLVGRT